MVDRITGLVLAHDGSHLPGAVVEIWDVHSHGDRPHASVKTDVHGGFEVHLQHPPKRVCYRLLIDGELVLDTRGTRHTDTSKPTPPVVLAPPKIKPIAGTPYKIAGRVLDATGAPASGREVALEQGRQALQTDVTSELGVFAVSAILPRHASGALELVVRDANGTELQRTSAPAEAPARPLELRLPVAPAIEPPQQLSIVQARFLDSVYTGVLTARASGMQSGFEQIEMPDHDRCACSDCEAAMSPVAYLVDLIQYAGAHLADAGGALTLDRLTTLLAQPFGELRVTCEEVDRAIRQVRICVESLRRLLGPAAPDVSDYCASAYEALLARIGTSSEELRVARTASSDDRIALAERLGIVLTPADELTQLLLEGAALTEAALEERFGIVDTTRDPLTDAPVAFDTQNQIVRLSLRGLRYRRATDPLGLVYIALSNPAGAYRVELFADSARTRRVAWGESTTASAVVRLVDDSGSGVSGHVELAYTAPVTNLVVRAIPLVLAWRLAKLREQWSARDRPASVFSAGATGQLPIVDPDLVGPDDFREPYPDRDPFRLWASRRAWVDQRIAELAALTDIDSALTRMSSQFTYATTSRTPWTTAVAGGDLEDLTAKLARRDSQAAAIETLATLQLSTDALARLVALRRKVQGGAALDSGEWREIVSILVQAVKLTFTDVWISEELAIVLGPEQFWDATRTMVEDEWPPVVPPSPLIDPGDTTRRIEDLPEATAGRRALALWRRRQAELDGALSDLVAARLANLADPWNAVFGVAFGTTVPAAPPWVPSTPPGAPPPPTPTWVDAISLVTATIASGGAGAASALAAATSLLQLSADELTRLGNLLGKATATPPGIVTAADWDEVDGILAIAYRARVLLPTWQAEETALGLRDWEALKVTRASWRAPAELRQTWRRALDAASAIPAIDPDQLFKSDLVNAVAGDPAFDLWQARIAEVSTLRTQITSATSAAGSLASFDAMLREGLYASDDGTVHVLDSLRAQITADRSALGLDFVVEQVLGIDIAALDALQTRYTAAATTEETRQLLEETLGLLASDLGPLETELHAAAPNTTTIDDVLSRAALTRSFLAILAADAAGVDTIPMIAQLGLTPASHGRLVALRTVAARTVLTPAELDEAARILSRARKTRWYARWRAEEAAQDIVLAPDRFTQPVPDPTDLTPPPPPQVDPWLGDRDARYDWLDTLQSRTDLEDSTAGAIATAVDATEEDQLPQLRAKLIAALPGLAATNADDRAEEIGKRLVMDTRDAGCRRTTRVAQAIESVQNLLFGVRTGELELSHPGLDLVNDASFDEEWRWLGSYATWRAAMFVFLYPENLLLPSLRVARSPAFVALQDALRSTTDLSPSTACALANEYSTYFDDVCHLELKASAYVRTREQDTPDPCCSANTPDPRHVVYAFATGPSGRVYWSTREIDAPPPGKPPQSFWTEIAAVRALDTPDVLGAVPYRVGDRGSLYLFLSVLDKGKHRIAVLTRDLDGGDWSSEPTLLAPRDDNQGFAVFVEQSATGFQPPMLVLQQADGLVIARRLDSDGRDWERTDFRVLATPDDSKIYPVILGAAEANHVAFYLFRQDVDGALSYHYMYDYDTLVFSTETDNGQDFYSSYDDFLQAVQEGAKPAPLSPDFMMVSTISWGPHTTPLYVLRDVDNVNARLLTAAEIDDTIVQNFPNKSVLGFVSTTFMQGTTALYFLHSPDQGGFGFHRVIPDLYVTDEQGAQAMISNGATSQQSVVVYVTCVNPTNLPTNANARWCAAVPWPFRGCDVVWKEGSATVYAQLTDAQVAPRSNAYPIDGDGLVWLSVDGNSSAQPIATAFTGPSDKPGLFTRALQRRTSDDATVKLGLPRRIAPSTDFYVDPKQVPAAPFAVTCCTTADERQLRKGYEAAFYTANVTGPAHLLVYLDEAYYGVPVQLAWELQGDGNYVEALDWLRTVYDYGVPHDDRKIWAPLVNEETIMSTFQRTSDWLLDPLDPHRIARTRPNCYTRFVIEQIARCFLDFADSEFTKDTAESVPRARVLYLTALELLGELDALDETGCDILVTTLGQAASDTDDPGIIAVWPRISAKLRELGSAAAIQAVSPQIQGLLAAPAGATTVAAINQIVDAARARSPVSPTVAAIGATRTARIDQFRRVVMREPAVLAAVAGLASAPDPYQPVPVTHVRPSETLPKIFGGSPALPDPNIDPGAGDPAPPAGYAPQLDPSFCIPPNPLIAGLELHARVNLLKIRTCRNFAGDQRDLDVYAAATDTFTGLPMLSASGGILLPGLSSARPTTYRYSTLVDRARQLAALAVTLEASMLSALEKRDAEAYTLLRAQQDVATAQAQLKLQDLRVHQAEDGVTLAQQQQRRVEIQLAHYDDLLKSGRNAFEVLALVFTGVSAALSAVGAGISFAENAAQGYSGLASSASSLAQLFSMMGQYERQREDWQYQRDLARQDLVIAQQQITLANDALKVVSQEQTIANLTLDHDQATVDFLANKFTNVELFDWMSRTLERVYGVVLASATSTARLAENQLAFERQETPQQIIQADYTTSPSDTLLGGATPDRKGLTGAEQLQADLTRLDDAAFLNNRRKLQVTRTLSMAQLFPLELAEFKTSGVLPFRTTTEMFDRDFPGHYLRLIRRVKVSVIALVPPGEGIRASLACLGTSRVVTGGDTFQTVTVKRDPETVALSSTQNASGVFDLDPQNDLLLPFEGSGVEASWELRMPRAANPFDFASIADVQVAFEYTALHSTDYERQVIQTLRPIVHDARAFSLRDDFADAWHDLNNPDELAAPFLVSFRTGSADFRPNLIAPKIADISLLYVFTDPDRRSPPRTKLSFTPDAGAPLGGWASGTVPLLSTQTGNADAWTSIAGESPVGTWSLQLPDLGSTRTLFDQDQLTDILLVIAVAGRTPDWPS